MHSEAGRAVQGPSRPPCLSLSFTSLANELIEKRQGLIKDKSTSNKQTGKSYNPCRTGHIGDNKPWFDQNRHEKRFQYLKIKK